MSAPNAGRQSPEPERQGDKQIHETPAGGSGKIDESSGKDDGKDDQTAGLDSNPKHILQDEADKKTSKTVG